jgi:hypothetical protein
MNHSGAENSAGNGSLRSGWVSGIGAGTAALALLFAVYLVLGFVDFVQDSGGQDLQLRWVQQNYVARGVNPHLVYPQTIQRTGRSEFLDPEIGYSPSVAQAPWSYALSMLLMPPIDWTWTKIHFAVLTVVFLVLQSWWIYRLAAPHEVVVRLFLVFSCLAFYANYMTIGLGQYSIVINLGIAGMLFGLERGRPVLAGLAFCLAMVKPQTTLLLILVPIVKGDWKCVVSAGLLLCGTTLAVAGWVGDWPQAMLLQVLDSGSDITDSMNFGLPHLLTRAGLEAGGVVPGLLFFGFLTTVLVYRLRAAPTVLLATIPLVVGQVWTYSRRYDQTNLYVLVAMLGLLALDRQGRRHWAAFLLVGASLWGPTSSGIWVLWLPLLQFAIWIGALFVLFSERSDLGARAPRPAAA